jgi:hypothetical protein
MRLLKAIQNVVSNRSETQSTTPSIDPEYAYMILSNARRRRVIDYLSRFDVGDQVPVGTIADHLADAYSDDRKCCYVSLIQAHLVKMETDRSGNGEGVVDYDERAKTITVREELHVLQNAHTCVQSVID